MKPIDFVQFAINNPEFWVENLGWTVDEWQPFIKENWQSSLNSLLADDVTERVAQLKQNLRAEQSIPGTQYQTLLEDSLANAISTLKAVTNWQTVRTCSVSEVAEQLATTGRQRLREQRVRQELMAGAFAT